MKVKDIIARDRAVFNMSYEDFIKWREDGYMSFLLDNSSRVNETDRLSLSKFINGEYDSLNDFEKSSRLYTIKSVTRFIQVECGVSDYIIFKRDKTINNIIN